MRTLSRRFLAVFTALALMIVMLPQLRFTANALTGSGTQEDPYKIRTADDLKGMGMFGYYALVNDIDLTGVSIASGLFTEYMDFRGVLDGRGYTISGLNINAAYSDYVGLFESCSGAEIKNLNVIGNVSGGNHVGGIVGRAENVKISCCTFSGNVTGYRNVGGFIGLSNGSLAVSDCVKYGSVSGYNCVGGIAGSSRGSSEPEKTSIRNCVNKGSVLCDENLKSVRPDDNRNCAHVGGIAGYTLATVIEYCRSENGSRVWNNAQKNEEPMWVGGIVGEAFSGSEIRYCSNAAEVGIIDSLASDTGGIAGELADNCSLTMCTNSGTVSGIYRTGGITGWNSGTVSKCLNTGSVKGVDRVGGITGVGSKIVENCRSEGSVIGKTNVGGLAGLLYAALKNSSNTGTVTGSDNNVGGAVGYSEKGTVTGCYNTASVTGGNNTAGITGLLNSSAVRECFNTGTVNSEHNDVGGVVGRCMESCTVSDCYNKGTVKGWTFVGGILGSGDEKTAVSNCFHWAKTDPDTIPSVFERKTYSGKLAGYYYKTKPKLDNCYFTDYNLYATGWKSTQEKGKFTYLYNTEMDETKYFPGWDFSKIWKMGSEHPELRSCGADGVSFFDGTVTVKEPEKPNITIRSRQDLLDFARAVNSGDDFTGRTVNLAADIDLTGIKWQTLKLFNGTFCGNGHIISGVETETNKYYSTELNGFFGILDGEGVIQDLCIQGNITGSEFLGGICAVNDGIIERCFFSGTVTTVRNGYAGGIVGYFASDMGSHHNNTTAGIRDCMSDAVIDCTTGGMLIGGIIGYDTCPVYRSIRNCLFTGSITGDSYYCKGSILGWGDVENIVGNCYGTGCEAMGCISTGKKRNYSSRDYAEKIDGSKLSDQKLFTDAGWDFTNTWCMSFDRPMLRQFCTDVTFAPNTETYTSFSTSQKESVTVPVNRLGDYIGVSFSPKQTFVFGGWNIKADGSGTPYNDKAWLVPAEGMVLYAQWYVQQLVLSITPSPKTYDFGVLYACDETPELEVKLTNSSTRPLELTVEGSDYFSVGSLSTDYLAYRGSATLTVRPRQGLLPGSYAGTVTVTGKNGDRTKTVTLDLTCTVEKRTFTPTLTVEDRRVTDEPKAPVLTGNESGGEVKFEYKKKGASDSKYSTKVPTNEGTYTVRATVAETDAYCSVTVTKDFKILPPPALRGDVDDNGVADVTDLSCVARYLARWKGYDETTLKLERAEFNGEAGVTAADYSLFARALAGWQGYRETYLTEM